jgi:hypothetical protein
MAEVWGQPAIPDPPETLGEIHTRFQGWVESHKSSARGYHQFVISVQMEEKYKAMRMADKMGEMLNFEVYVADDCSEDDGNEELLRMLEDMS